MDVAKLDAIDVHTHVHRSVNAPPVTAGDNEHLAAMAAYFKTPPTSRRCTSTFKDNAARLLGLGAI